MTDIITSTWPTSVGTGTTYTPYTSTTTWNSEYAERKQLEAWMRILVERIDKLQDKFKELEGRIDGR